MIVAVAIVLVIRKRGSYGSTARRASESVEHSDHATPEYANPAYRGAFVNRQAVPFIAPDQEQDHESVYNHGARYAEHHYLEDYE